MRKHFLLLFLMALLPLAGWAQAVDLSNVNAVRATYPQGGDVVYNAQDRSGIAWQLEYQADANAAWEVIPNDEVVITYYDGKTNQSDVVTFKDAGTYYIQIDAKPGSTAFSNGIVAGKRCEMKIEKNSIAITVQNATKVYGDNDPASLVWTVNANQNLPEPAENISITFNYERVTAVTAQNFAQQERVSTTGYDLNCEATAKNYTVQLNYEGNQAKAKLMITPRTLTVKYGKANDAAYTPKTQDTNGYFTKVFGAANSTIFTNDITIEYEGALNDATVDGIAGITDATSGNNSILTGAVIPAQTIENANADSNGDLLLVENVPTPGAYSIDFTNSTLAATNYTIEYEPRDMRIKQIDIDAQNFFFRRTPATATTTYTYNGQEQGPEYEVYVGAAATGTKLTEDTDYTLTVNENEGVAKNAGDYTVKLVGKGNYGGTIDHVDAFDFSIAPKALTVRVKNYDADYNGEAFDPEVSNNRTKPDQKKIIFSKYVPSDLEATLDNFGGQVTLEWDDNNNAGSVKDAGDYTMYVKVADNPNGALKNYSIAWTHQENNVDVHDITGTFTVNKLAIAAAPKDINFDLGSQPLKTATTDENGYVVPTLNATNIEITPANGYIAGDAAAIYAALKLTVAHDATAYTTTGLKEGKAVLTLLNGQPTNYTITCNNGDVTVNNATVEISIDTKVVTYGALLKDIEFEPYAEGMSLGNNLRYTVYKANGTDTWGENDRVAAGTWKVVLDKTSIELPEGYTAADPEEGYLLVQPKPVILTVAPISMNAGDDVDKLNEFAPAYVADYSDLVFDGDELDFTFEFNTDETVLPQVNPGLLNNDDELKTAAEYTAGNYAYWDEDNKTLSQVVNLVPGINANYDVAVVKANIILVGAGDLVLNQSDPNLNSKIKDAADDNDPVRAISFSSRELKAGYWYTMVLPFDIRTADLVASLKAVDDPQAQNPTYHTVYAIVNRFSTASTTDHIQFKLEMSSIPANEPFMIKTAEDIDLADAKFGDQTIKYAVAPKITDETGSNAGNEFVGVYTTTSIQAKPATNYYPAWYDSENTKADPLGPQWRVPGSAAVDVAPMEAYLVYSPEKSWNNNAPLITFEDLNENGTTSIVTFNADSKSFVNVDGWYTLNGVKLQGAPTEKGIYINNGKKIVIK